MAFGNRTTFGQARPAASSQPSATAKDRPNDAGHSKPFFLRVIGRAIAASMHNGVTFLALVAAAAVPERAAYHLMPADNLRILPILIVLSVMSRIALLAAVTRGAFDAFRGEPADFRRCMETAALAYPAVFVIFALSAMSVLAGSLLLIVPGVVLVLGWAVAVPVSIAEGTDTRTSFARSWALTEGYRWQILRLLLLLGFLGYWIGRAMLPLWGMPPESLPAFVLDNWLWPLFMTAFAGIGCAALYYELRQAEDGGVSPETA